MLNLFILDSFQNFSRIGLKKNPDTIGIQIYFFRLIYESKRLQYYLYITFLTAFTTSLLLGNHSFNRVGEYGAGVSAVVIR